MKRVQCATCDNLTSMPDRNGFCGTCAGEFEQIRQKLICRCEDCKTPLACLTAKECLFNPSQLELL